VRSWPCGAEPGPPAYLEVIADFNVSEKRLILHNTAAEIYGL
jgi:hypothetical protein